MKRSLQAGAQALAATLALSVGAFAAPTTIDFSYNAGGDQEKALLQAVAQFNAAHSDIQVKPANITALAGGGQWFNKLLTLIAGGSDVPDIYMMEQNKGLALMAQGEILPLDPFMARGFDTSDLAPGSMAAGALQGVQYGLPYASDVALYFQNRSLLDNAGVSLSNDWTLADYLSAAQKTTVRDGNTVSRWGTDVYAMSWLFPLWMPIFGGKIIDTAHNNDVVLDSPANQEALQWLVDLPKHGVAPDPAHEEWNDYWGMFANEKVALQVNYSWWVRQLRTDAAGVDWDVLPLPKGPAGEGNLIIPGLLMIDRHAEDAQAAWTFLQYLSSPEVERQLVVQSGSLFARKSFFSSDLYTQGGGKPQNWIGVRNAFLAATTYPAIGDLDQVKSIVGKPVADAFKGTPVKSALVQAAQAVQNELTAYAKK